MQPTTKVRRKNGRNWRENHQHVTPKVRAGVRWAAEYRALTALESDVVELLIKEQQWA